MAEEKKQLTVVDRLNQAKGEFQRALPAHIPVEKFLRTVQTAVSMSPEVQAACTTAGGVQSLMIACAKAAADGLVIDGREAALVTFNTKVSKNPDKWEKRLQYMPMYQGLLKKLRNSGELGSISAHVVFEKDEFLYQLGDEEKIVHVPAQGGKDRGRGIAVYAIARLKDGSVQREVMFERAILMIGSQGKNGDQYDQEKGRNWGEWWRKTVIRRIVKMLPASSDRDFMQAIEHADEEFDFDTETTKAEALPAPKKRGGGAAALKDITPAKEPAEVDVDYDPDTGEIIEPKQLDDDVV